jgi:hypothetical protein
MSDSTVSHLRRLTAVPDPPKEHPVLKALTWVHLWNGAIKQRWELERLAREARAAGLSEYAGHLDAAVASVVSAEDRVRG